MTAPTSHPPIIRLALRLLSIASAIVPADDRDAWRQEWRAEIEHRWTEIQARGFPSLAGQLDLLRRAVGAARDAVSVRRAASMDFDVVGDVRHALRLLMARPAFSLTAIGVLAVGIGATTAIFSVVDLLLLRELPYREPDRIVTIWQQDTRAGVERGDVAPANFLDWRDESRAFERIAAAEPMAFDYLGGPEPESVAGALVTEGFFGALGVDPVLGRGFVAEDHQTGAPLSVVITYGSWQRRFGGSPSIVGRAIQLEGTAYTLVGVLPPEFEPGLLQGRLEREIWAPKAIQPYEPRIRGSAYWNVAARLKPGVTLEAARAEMRTISRRLEQAHPRTNTGVVANVVPLRDHLAGSVRTPVLVLAGAVALVLLIACANVANLLLAHGAERSQEFAVRMALGARRSRLVRQLLTESAVLALVGCAGGVALASWGLDVIVGLAPGGVGLIEDARIDVRVLVFALVLSLSTAILFGLAPALQFSRPVMHDRLKDGARGSSGGVGRRRIRGALIVAETALALVLLIGAGLLLRSFALLTSVDPGFSTRNVASLQVFTYGQRYRTADQRRLFYEQALERIRTLPGIEAAGLVSAMPFAAANINMEAAFAVEGSTLPPDQQPSTFLTAATTDYFRAMSIPLREGRLFGDADGPRAPTVALVNRTMADRYWPGSTPLGSRVTTMFTGQKLTAEIVGVVGEVRHDGFDSQPRPEIFFHHAQVPFGSMTFVVRTAGDAAAAIQSIKQQVWSLDPTLPFYDAATVDQLVSKSLTPKRFSLLLLGAFALAAFALAAIGIYGVISVATAQRTHEIGVRMAMGARAADIRRLVVGQGMWLVMAGIAIGVAGALPLTRLMRTLLFGITATDPLTIGAVSLLLAAVAAIACYLPARRATHVDPLHALRYE
jgi:putative ABC transport system permease protein